MKQTNEWLQDVTTSQGWGQYRSIYFVYWVNFGLNFRHKAGWFVTLSSQCCEKLEVSEPILISREPTHKCALSQPPTMWQELTTWPALNVIWPPYTSRFTCLVLFCCGTNERSRAFSPLPTVVQEQTGAAFQIKCVSCQHVPKSVGRSAISTICGCIFDTFSWKTSFFYL